MYASEYAIFRVIKTGNLMGFNGIFCGFLTGQVSDKCSENSVEN
jgi:hypothetical protein